MTDKTMCPPCDGMEFVQRATALLTRAASALDNMPGEMLDQQARQVIDDIDAMLAEFGKGPPPPYSKPGSKRAEPCTGGGPSDA